MKPIGLWDFAVAVYGRRGVEAACLRLQDQAGVDVPVLLFCLWAGLYGPGRLAAADMDRACAIGLPWGRAVAAPLRAARRALKDETLGAAAARLELRQRVITAERDSERLAFEQLEIFALTLPGGERSRAAAHANTALFVGAAGSPALQMPDSDLDLLVGAAEAVRPIAPDPAETCPRGSQSPRPSGG